MIVKSKKLKVKWVGKGGGIGVGFSRRKAKGRIGVTFSVNGAYKRYKSYICWHFLNFPGK